MSYAIERAKANGDRLQLARFGGSLLASERLEVQHRLKDGGCTSIVERAKPVT